MRVMEVELDVLVVAPRLHHPIGADIFAREADEGLVAVRHMQQRRQARRQRGGSVSTSPSRRFRSRLGCWPSLRATSDSPERQSRSEALTGTIGARRAWTASMISALSMPWR